jgi:nucleosome binding factor SPN SPT16 subunit
MMTIQDRHPELLDDGNFPKDIGAGIGIELRDNNNLLDQGSLGKAKAGMAFNVTIGMCIHVCI